MLRKALAALDEGDTLGVVRLDRLARSTDLAICGASIGEDATGLVP
jgi:DNA invertase Pin-like site-specific DNA recombinase